MSGCIDCGKALSSRNTVGRCRGCFGRYSQALRRIHPDKFCRVCSKPLSRQSTTGLCREHFMSERMQSPETQAKRTAGIRKHCSANLEKRRAQLRANQRKALREKPSYREYLRQRMKELQPLAVAASLMPEALARRGRAISEANERRRVKPEPKRPMTFEEQLEAVASGRARVVEKWCAPSQDYDFTLAGVQDW